MSPRRALLLGVLALAAVLGALAWLARAGEPVDVTIPPGLSAAETASLLEAKGVVRFGALFRAAAKLSRADRRLKPGTYRLRARMPVFWALRALTAGQNNDVKVTIPEGFSAKQIAERLEAAGVAKASEFLALVQGPPALEGTLFPTTYHLRPGSGAEAAAKRMTAEFDRQIRAEWDKTAERPKLTLHQAVTLASIVEREAAQSDEKPMIAAVYFNRLRKRMRLEADPTVQYALGYWKKGLTLRDLQDPSPYNTYLRYGLPPGPICSPGLASVRAVLRPARTDALFFVADNTGGHVFSATIEEHLKAKQAFKRGRAVINRRIREEERRANKKASLSK